MAEIINKILMGLQNLGAFAYNHPYITAFLTVIVAYTIAEAFKRLKRF